MDEATVLSLCHRHGIFPKSVAPHASLGIDNHVWFIGTDYVLRTPRGEDGAVYMAGETEIWEYVHAQGMRVPEVAASGLRDDGLPYMIVRRSPGRLLGETEFDRDLGPFVEDLVDQLVLLHSLPIAGRLTWARPFDEYDPWPYFRRAWDTHALPRLVLLEIEALIRCLAARQGNYKTGAEQRTPPDGAVLTHNDLHAWNIMVEGDPPRLAAIIDWGDACLSDRRNDLATLPLSLQIQIAEYYRRRVPVGPDFEARILWAWIDIAFWEIMNMEALGFHRPWWRWPVGGWEQAKQILRAAPGAWPEFVPMSR